MSRQSSAFEAQAQDQPARPASPTPPLDDSNDNDSSSIDASPRTLGTPRNESDAFRYHTLGTQDQAKGLLDEDADESTAIVPAANMVRHVQLNPTTFSMALFLDKNPALRSASSATDPMLSWMMPWLQAAQTDSALCAVTQAHALASLAYSSHDAALGEQAFWQYNNSIRRIRSALEKNALSDDTLLAVRLLGHVEATTGFGEDSLNHFFGMISLVTTRGTSRTHSLQDVMLFRQLRISTCVFSMMYGLPLPPFPHPQGWLFDCPPRPNPAHTLSELMVETTALRAQSNVTHESPSSPSKADSIQALREHSLDLTHRLSVWRQQLPPAWRYESIDASYDLVDDTASIEAADIWPGAMHLYHNDKIAFQHGLFRIISLCALSVALRALHWQALHNDVKYRPLYRTSIFNLLDRANGLVSDMCASVPWHLGVNVLPPALGHLQSRMAELHGDAAYTIYSWLFITTWVESVPHKQRTWIEGRLRAIAARGLPKAANTVRLTRWSRGLMFAEAGAWEMWVGMGERIGVFDDGTGYASSGL